MAFVRVKRISGKEYAYLVANSWTATGPRQKVAKYLGKVIRPEKAKSEKLEVFLGLAGEAAMTEWIKKSSFREIAAHLTRLELGNHNVPTSIKTDTETTEFLDEKGRQVVLAINDGFLCAETAKKLLEYDAAADYSGYGLADALTAAGIAVDKDVFISLFGKAQAATKKEKETKDAFKDFYY
ncbi:TPA: hypothetical protein HA231_05435 [Candidatus Woesearchaeota archaeon]|nr:hypothetical protein [Candidatus Woesearchaeota archaeon]